MEIAKNKVDEAEKQGLLQFLAEALRDTPNISGAAFNDLPNRIATERVYRRFFGTWNKAKALAAKLLPQTDITKSTTGVDLLKRNICNLRKENAKLYKERLTATEIREQIFNLEGVLPAKPSWLVDIPRKTSIHGIPVLLLSDFHMGEIVRSEQVFDVNEFNLNIAEQRIKLLAKHVLDILVNHLSSKYPGLVLLLNGDFVSGCIHEELLITNEQPIMPVVVRTYNILIWFIELMHKTIGNVQVFCCHGNHSRTFKKPIHKDAALSSYDWLIYTMLDRYFKDNVYINFNIAIGDDIQFKVYNHHYRMTHGGQFRGGQGFLGHIAPITRGEIRKRSAAESYGMNYDTLLLGHFHSYGHFKRVITNGSLVGYSEYSMNNNFPYERPQQALWLNHPDHGITFSVPIFCTQTKLSKKTEWVSWVK